MGQKISLTIYNSFQNIGLRQLLRQISHGPGENKQMHWLEYINLFTPQPRGLVRQDQGSKVGKLLSQVPYYPLVLFF